MVIVRQQLIYLDEKLTLDLSIGFHCTSRFSVQGRAEGDSRRGSKGQGRREEEREKGGGKKQG